MNQILQTLSTVSLILLTTSCHDISSSNKPKPKNLEKYHHVVDKTVTQPSNQCQPQCENSQAECQHVEYLNTPAYKDGVIINIPNFVKKQVFETFFNDTNTMKDIDIIYGIPNEESGDIKYNKNQMLSYLFSQDLNFRNGIYYTSPYQNNTAITEFDQQIMLKVISILGSGNPKIFLEELLASEPINHCSTCIIKQKQSIYGMIELSVCEADNAIAFSLYEP